MITLWSEPPPCRGAPLFKLAHDEEQEQLPGFRQLLPVLWEMDILPDVLVLPDGPWWENAGLYQPRGRPGVGCSRVHGFALRTGNGPPASSGTISMSCSPLDLTGFVPDGSGL